MKNTYIDNYEIRKSILKSVRNDDLEDLKELSESYHDVFLELSNYSLILCAEQDQFEMAVFLIESGAEINDYDNNKLKNLISCYQLNKKLSQNLSLKPHIHKDKI